MAINFSFLLFYSGCWLLIFIFAFNLYLYCFLVYRCTTIAPLKDEFQLSDTQAYRQVVIKAFWTTTLAGKNSAPDILWDDFEFDPLRI